jgi:hypothetical protein
VHESYVPVTGSTTMTTGTVRAYGDTATYESQSNTQLHGGYYTHQPWAVMTTTVVDLATTRAAWIASTKTNASNGTTFDQVRGSYARALVRQMMMDHLFATSDGRTRSANLSSEQAARHEAPRSNVGSMSDVGSALPSQQTNEARGPASELAAPGPSSPLRELVQATPACLLAADGFTVQTILNVRWFDPREQPRSVRAQRELWRLDCQFDTGTCDGMKVNLVNVDNGGPLRLLDVAVLQGARITSRTRNVFTVQWGPYRVMTLDLAAGRVAYRESAANTEGVGEASCDAPTLMETH